LPFFVSEEPAGEGICTPFPIKTKFCTERSKTSLSKVKNVKKGKKGPAQVRRPFVEAVDSIEN
jgi:hypothetical protein